MSVDLKAPSADQFTAFSSGNEAMLATVFRERYDALVAMAKEALGADLEHYSGRVAQQAMLSAWTNRASLENPTGLMSNIASAVQKEAGLQIRKHAALHQRGAGAAPRHVVVPSAEEAVTELMATLHAPAADHAKALAEVEATRRSNTAKHAKQIGNKGGWIKPTLLAIGLGAALWASIYFANIAGANNALDKVMASEDTRKITARPGQRGQVTLSDSTKVKVGSDSRVLVPAAYGTTMRTVDAFGAAEFTVAPGNLMPFRVRAGQAIVDATGTKLSVRAYPEDSTAAISVTEGSVTVTLREGKGERTVAAGQAVFVAKDGAMSDLTGDAKDAAFSWTRDSLVFANAPVSAVLVELRRWFDSKPTLGDPALGARPVTMRVSLTSSGDAIKALETVAHLLVGFDKKNGMVFGDAPATPVAPAKKKK